MLDFLTGADPVRNSTFYHHTIIDIFYQSQLGTFWFIKTPALELEENPGTQKRCWVGRGMSQKTAKPCFSSRESSTS